jgi:hypothetical protein
MKYVDLDATIACQRGGIDPGKYLEVLPVLALRLPAGALALAADPEHYDYFSRHCVKDLRISRSSSATTWRGLRSACVTAAGSTRTTSSSATTASGN